MTSISVTDTAAQSNELQQAVAMVRSRSTYVTCVAIILGSGLGGLADEIQDAVAIDYHDIPGFARSTASGHRGQLILGLLEGKPVVAMADDFIAMKGTATPR